MEHILLYLNYADLMRRTFDVTFLLLLILLLRRAFGERLLPAYRRILWGIVGLRIIFPVQLPLLCGLYSRFGLDHFYEHAEQWISQSNSKNGFVRYLATHSPLEAMTNIWLLGAIIVTAVFIFQNIRFHRHIRRHAHLYGIRDKLPVYIIDDQSGSCLTGIANPEIYVSQNALHNLNWCKWIVAHELGHYRAKDNLYHLVLTICLIFLWFHPLVWYCAKVAGEDCEMACDDRILEHADQDACTEYGQCLVAMASGNFKKALAAAPVSNLNKTSLKKRVIRIANYHAYDDAARITSKLITICISLIFILCIVS